MQKETTLINNKTVLVMGGRGFIGRYIVKHLKLLGAKVVIGTRFESNHRGFRQIKLQHIHRTPNWAEVLEGIDVVVNTCLLYTSPSPRDQRGSRMPSSA